MEPFLIFLGVLAVAVCLLITILTSNRNDNLKTEVDILRKRNSTLEEKFEQMEPQENPSVEETTHASAADTLECFAKENGCKLENHQDDDSPWVEYTMRYQGGNYLIYTHLCEMIIRFHNFAEIETTQDTYMQVLALCNRLNDKYRYFKLTYSHNEEQNLFILSMYIDLLNPPYDWLNSIFNANWDAVNIVRKEVERIREECGLADGQESGSNPQSETSGGVSDAPDTSSLIALQKSIGGEA